MQIKYFDTAWNDIKNSPGWFGKICLMALIMLIPVFGIIVVMGYLFGWARDMAWGVRQPMPAKIFGNEDGKLYRRGFFVCVVQLVFLLVPAVVFFTLVFMLAGALGFAANGNNAIGVAAAGTLIVVLMLAFIIVYFLAYLYSWVGSMRSSIYDNLSSGFQLGKIRKMFKYDSSGLWRILGMAIVVGFVVSFVVSIVVFVLAFVLTMFGAAGFMGFAAAGYNPSAISGFTAAASLGTLSGAFVVSLIIQYVGLLGTVFMVALVYRALGYWTWQFNVPAWRGQDEPMPFEIQQQQQMPLA
jgi:hypothetical protein